MTNLENFPKCYCITLEESVDRHEHLYKQCSKYNISYLNLNKSKRFDDCEDIIHGPFVHTLSNSNKGASTSHLRSIKKWLSETDASDNYAIFFEDDVSFKTVDYWNFTWDEFVKNLPSDWEAVQLMWVRPHMVKMELRERYSDDWSATAFMITRQYGKKLLDRFLINDHEFNYDMGDLQPIVENVIFTSGRVYSCPLFVEETDLSTTFINSSDYNPDLVQDGQTKNHHSSQTTVLNWWKNVGKNISIEEFTNTHILPQSFDWGEMNYFYMDISKKDLGRNNIYEKFFKVQSKDVVLDIGSGPGQFSFSIIRKNPKVIYCVENRQNYFNLLIKNTSKFSINTPIVYVNQCINEETTFMKFLKEYEISKVDYLKVDYFGVEYEVFNSENINWILENVGKIWTKFHLYDLESKNKFRYFRDHYLEFFKEYYIFSSVNQQTLPGFELNLTRWIYDDLFFENYNGELILYAQNIY